MLIDLDTRLGYNIATALRGPDSDTYEAELTKKMTTAVLRWAVNIPSIVGAIVKTPQEAQDFWHNTCYTTGRNFIKTYWRRDRHFRGHTINAWEALKSIRLYPDIYEAIYTFDGASSMSPKSLIEKYEPRDVQDYVDWFLIEMQKPEEVINENSSSGEPDV